MDEYLGMDEAMLSQKGKQSRGRRKRRQGLGLVLAGVVLIGCAAGLYGYNIHDDLKAGDLALKELHKLEEILGIDADGDGMIGDQPLGNGSSDGSSGSAYGETESGEDIQAGAGLHAGPVPVYEEDPDMAMPTITAGGESYVGFLRIPVIDRTLPVMEEWSYPHLKIAPGVYKGTPYKKNFIICAHNYERHFGLIKTLKQGDKVIFVDGYGDIFRYHVGEVEILQPTAVEEMESGDWDLTMFTCTIGGATRVTVRCILDDSTPSWWPKDQDKTQGKVNELYQEGQKQ